MKRIPPELAIRIFRLLHQGDKLQCMLVCREWEFIIKSTILLETLRISSKEGLDSVISTVKQKPFYGMQVKRLIFQVDPGSDFDMASLPSLFPNVFDCYINPSIDISPDSHPFRFWHNKLTQFFEDDIDGIEILIKSKIWPNITTLALSGNARYLSAKSHIHLLKNTPGLKELTLLDMDYSMDDFEFIHSQLPSLKSLSIKGRAYDGSNPPAKIIPATSVTTLFLVCATLDLVSKKKLFSYVSQKYPNVSDLTLHATGRYGIPDYKTKKGYEEWDGILVNVASRLQNIDLRWNNDSECSYVLKALDERHCRPKSLSVTADINTTAITLLPELNLVKHLESFKIKGPWCCGYEWLEPMFMLTEIEIDMDSRLNIGIYSRLNISITNIVTMCGPHLQSIICKNGKFSFDVNSQNETVPVFNQIKKFEFYDTKLPANIGAIITRFFPQVHTLKFNGCFNREKFERDEIHLILPDRNLRTLQVLDEFGSDRYIVVLTRCDNKSRLYTAAGAEEAPFSVFEERFGLYDLAVYPPPISMDYGTKSTAPFMTVVCNSLKDICLLDV
jgi:hypothetical protein